MMQIIKAEFDGHTMQFREDGWFNATVAAERFGKRVDHWLANRETDQYITALSELLNTRNSGELIHARKGRNGGTWLHPKLAVAFARWLDVRFAVWCDMQIDGLLRTGYVRITEEERSYWQQMIALEVTDAESKVHASLGSRLMLARKKMLPMIRGERSRLKALMQSSLLLE
ncbi:KilA-N domain-containing protein [Microvirgula aerodenitrificans]|uniref:KilA-N domain-containing protein n=1 Tax=Microvirgula aerodenitrificans TaxID=57480 RepID=UPI0012EBEA24|nr:KilA-N domain-containing protein [Microvirgula aerodenitrificans]